MMNIRIFTKLRHFAIKYEALKIILIIITATFLTSIVFTGCYKNASQSSSISASQSSSISEALNSGVTGIAMISPLHPVEQISEVNEAPYPDAVIIIKNKTSREEIKRIFVDKNGKFKIPLLPGDYILDAKNKTGNVLPISQPIDITVLSDKYTDIIVQFDSGIR